MRHTLLTTALLLWLAAPDPAQAQDTRYRVEVIVLSHLQHAEAPREVATVRDYGDALDFLTPEATADDEAPESAATPTPEPPVGETDTPGDDPLAESPTTDTAAAEPPAVVHIEELGEVMQDAWRRLRLSGPFRPLVALAWEQADTPPFPQLRVHDQDVVMAQDPWAAVRVRLEAGEPVDAWFEAGLVPPLPPLPPDDVAASPGTGTALDAALPENSDDADPAAALLERLPPPRLFYALDGTVSLVRSRFLHFHIDLQQREAVYDAAPAAPVVLPRGLRTLPAAASMPDPDAAAADPVPTAFRVYALEQNRQVKTGQVEYFDGPVLSVLAYITAIETEPAAD
ncbi:MAG: CsiV family protein [Xanthomonadales bacterium]